MKKISIALICMSFAQAVAASEMTKTNAEKSSNFKVTLGGTLDTQAGYRSQKSALNTDLNGNPLHKGAIVNETRIVLDAQGKLGNIKYGGYIQMYADVSPHYNGPNPRIGKKLFAFVETKYGRSEFGGGQAASAQMQISANTIARLPGGINGKAQKWMGDFVYLPGASKDSKKVSSHFVKWPSLPIDADHESAAGKVTYITPKVNGLQAGFTYIVDSELRGTVSSTQSVFRTKDKEYNNVFDGAIKYEAKFNDIEFATALTGQMGDAKRKTSTLARHDLRAWELGALAKYKGFSLAGSYSDWHHSASPKFKVNGEKSGASYWTAGVGYERDKLGTSITYFNSIRANVNSAHPFDPNFSDVGFNRFELLCIGADYKLMPGFMPYAELSLFRMKHKGAAISNRGTIILAGTKLSF